MVIVCQKCDRQFDAGPRQAKLLPCRHLVCLDCLEKRLQSDGGKRCPVLACDEGFQADVAELTSVPCGEKVWCLDCDAEARGACIKAHTMRGQSQVEQALAVELDGALDARAAALRCLDEDFRAWIRAEERQLQQEQEAVRIRPDPARLRELLAAAKAHPLLNLKEDSADAYAQAGGVLRLRCTLDELLRQGTAEAKTTMAEAEMAEATAVTAAAATAQRDDKDSMVAAAVKRDGKDDVDGEHQAALLVKVKAVESTAADSSGIRIESVFSIKTEQPNEAVREAVQEAVAGDVEQQAPATATGSSALAFVDLTLADEDEDPVAADDGASQSLLPRKSGKRQRSSSGGGGGSARKAMKASRRGGRSSAVASSHPQVGPVAVACATNEGGMEVKESAKQESTPVPLAAKSGQIAPSIQATSATQNPAEPPCHLDSLPDVLLARIFATLPNLEDFDVLVRIRLVCKRWAGVVLDEAVWQHRAVRLRYEIPPVPISCSYPDGERPKCCATWAGRVGHVAKLGVRFGRLELDVDSKRDPDLALFELERLRVTMCQPKLLRLTISLTDEIAKHAISALQSGKFALQLDGLDLELVLGDDTATSKALSASVLRAVNGMARLKEARARQATRRRTSGSAQPRGTQQVQARQLTSLRLSQRTTASAVYQPLDLVKLSHITALQRLAFGSGLGDDLKKTLLQSNRNSLLELDLGDGAVLPEVSQCTKLKTVILQTPVASMNTLWQSLESLEKLGVAARSDEAMKLLAEILDGVPDSTVLRVHLLASGFTPSLTLRELAGSLKRVRVLRLSGKLFLPEAELARSLAALEALEELSYDVAEDCPPEEASVWDGGTDWRKVVAVWTKGMTMGMTNKGSAKDMTKKSSLPPRLRCMHVHYTARDIAERTGLGPELLRAELHGFGVHCCIDRQQCGGVLEELLPGRRLQ